jgi:hypothetical protein
VLTAVTSELHGRRARDTQMDASSVDGSFYRAPWPLYLLLILRVGIGEAKDGFEPWAKHLSLIAHYWHRREHELMYQRAVRATASPEVDVKRS